MIWYNGNGTEVLPIKVAEKEGKEHIKWQMGTKLGDETCQRYMQP